MKKFLSLFLILFVFHLAKAQEYESVILKSSLINSNKLITFNNMDGNEAIQILSKTKRLKKSKLKLKPLRINGEDYTLIRQQGVLNLKDATGNIVAATNNTRSLVFIDSKSYTKKAAFWNTANVSYLDDEGKAVVNIVLKNRRLLVEYLAPDVDDALLAIALEEAIQGYRNYINFIM